MAKRKKLEESFINPFITNLDEAGLRAHRRKLAKAVNQRMVRLERGKSLITKKEISSMEYGAYAGASNYLRQINRNRFSEQAKYGSLREVREEILYLQDFILSKTSTVGGFHKAEKARIKAFKAAGIQSADTKQFYDFLNTNTFKELAESFDSDKLIEVFDTYNEKEHAYDEIIEAFEDYKNSQSMNNPLTIQGMEEFLDARLVRR